MEIIFGYSRALLWDNSPGCRSAVIFFGRAAAGIQREFGGNSAGFRGSLKLNPRGFPYSRGGGTFLPCVILSAQDGRKWPALKQEYNIENYFLKHWHNLQETKLHVNPCSKLLSGIGGSCLLHRDTRIRGNSVKSCISVKMHCGSWAIHLYYSRPVLLIINHK